MESHPGLPPEAAERLLEQVFSIWITPEIERRRTAGLIGEDWPFRAAQIVFNVGGTNEVRLNEQVRAQLQVRATRPITQGEAIRSVDFSEIVSVKLTNPDGNAGHVSIFLHNDRFFLFCDFRYNGHRVRATLAVADEFLASAQAELTSGRLRPAITSLHVAVEGLAKCYLLLLPDPKVLVATTHGFVLGRFGSFTNLGNAPTEYAKLLRDLSENSAAARYSTEPLRYGPTVIGQMLETARAMRRDLIERVPPNPVAAYPNLGP